MKKITLSIDGMMCGMCEAHMNDAIRQHFNVKKVSSSHKKKETVILTEAELDRAALEDVIQKMGYTLIDVHEEPYTKKGLFGF